MSLSELKLQTLEELKNTKFPKNYSRRNVSLEPTEAFALGQVNYRGQKKLNYKTRGPSRFNKKFGKLYRLLRKLIRTYKPDFKYTTIQVNKNIQCNPHVDKNNIGPSYIIGLGDYKDGELVIEGIPYNIINKFKFFDGNKGHWVNKFKGNRYTIVYFTHTFKPPHPRLRNITVTKKGIYDNNTLVKKY